MNTAQQISQFFLLFDTDRNTFDDALLVLLVISLRDYEALLDQLVSTRSSYLQHGHSIYRATQRLERFITSSRLRRKMEEINFGIHVKFESFKSTVVAQDITSTMEQKASLQDTKPQPTARAESTEEKVEG